MNDRTLFGIASKSISSFLLCFFMIACAIEGDNIPEMAEDQELSLFPNYDTELIENQYIIVLHENKISFKLNPDDYEGSHVLMRKEATDFLRSHKLDPEVVDRTFTFALTGFTAKIDKERIQDVINDPRVKYVEQDRMGMLGKKPKNEEDPIVSTQVIPWGVERVGGPFQYRGRNSVFVVDTGIDLDHPDLNVDEKKGFDPYQEKKKDWNLDDEHGHGTHVAGTIAALDNHYGVVGVAAGVPVVPVKIFTGPRAAYTYSGMIAGIEHIGVRGIPGDVANLSFGGFDSSTALDEAVLNVSEKRRIWMVIAAGNSALTADSFSPARVNGKHTITVSAFQRGDIFASFSHFGPPIKFSAPGVGILSTWINARYVNSTGTSMAAPHVAGLRVLGDVYTNGYVLRYPLSVPNPIAYGKPE